MEDERLNELYQDYCDLTFEERVENCRSAYFKLREELIRKGHDDHETLELIFGLMGVCCCVDGVPGRKEHELFLALTKSSITYDKFIHLLQGTKTEEMIEGADRLVDSLSPEGKDAAMVFALCFLSADGKIDVYEKQLFAKLIT